MPNNRPTIWLDHFVVAIDNLNAGVASFEAMTGVRPVLGGEHPTLGTHNALVSLGDQQYFEILAPKPGATVHPMFRGVEEYDVLTPLRWAVAVDDIGEVHRTVTSEGYRAQDIIPGSRKTQSGATLRWKMFTVDDERLSNAPFFIEWDETAEHPSHSTPTGCSTLSYVVTSPQHQNVHGLLLQFGFDVAVREGPVAMEIRLDTPNGAVTIGQ